MVSIEEYISDGPRHPFSTVGYIRPETCALLRKFHEDHLHLINVAQGSASKHQPWKGGYRDHIEQCLTIARMLYTDLPFVNHRWEDVFIVLYFHDIEKIWKYTDGTVIDKEVYFNTTLRQNYGIEFTDDQKNALKYIHGEGEDYCEHRVMNDLAAICHCCDTLSARAYYNKRDI